MRAGSRARHPILLLAGALAVGLSSAPPASAQAPSAEDRYVVARDAAVARFTPQRVPTIDKRAMDAEASARADLEKQMRAIIGAAAPAGFDPGKFNLNTLFSSDMDFGKLDGLVFETDGGDTQMVVTTRPLLQQWLNAKRQDASNRSAPPDAAIRTEGFFMQALGNNAAILRFAEIPMPDKSAFAMLAARTQDAVPLTANEVFVAAIRGDRVYVANTPFEPGLTIDACTAQREVAERKLEEATQELKPGTRNDATMQRLIKQREQVETDFRRCFAEQAPKDRSFAEATKLAKELFDKMALK